MILVEASPRNAGTGAVVTTRFAGGGGAAPFYYAGEHWRAGLVGLPTIVASVDFKGTDLGTGSVPQAMSLRWAPSSSAALAGVADLHWIDAAITVRIGPAGSLPPVLTSGKVIDTSISDGILTVALSDPAADLKQPILKDRFLGFGGIEGPAEWEGRIKRRVWGCAFNIEGDPIDGANHIYCYGDPTRRWQAFLAVRDKGAAASALNVLAWQGSAAATFAALQAAAAPAGGGVACPSIACVKWWTQPAGALCADIQGEIGSGYEETAPAIAQRIVAAVSSVQFAPGAVAAAIASRPAVVGWVAEDETGTAAAALDALLGDVSLQWVLVDDLIVLREWAWSASVASARSVEVSRKATFKPVARRRIGYRQNHHVMTRDALAGIVLATDVVLEDGSTAQNLKAAVDAAQAAADAAIAEIVAIASDTVLSHGSEKQRAVIDWAALSDERGALDAQFAALGSPADIAAAHTAMGTAIDALAAYLGTLDPDWNDGATDTPIVSATWVSKWGAAYNKLAAFRAAITGRPGNDGLDGIDGLPGAPGANGQTSYFHTAYADSADGATNFTTGAPGARTYIGVYVDFSPADSASPAVYTWSKFVGADGANGTPGAPGANGQPSYVHFAWANSADGTTGFSTTVSAGKLYIGVYTDFTLADSNSPAAYRWSKIKGDDGLQGAAGTPGAPGANVQTSYVHFAYADNATGSVNFTTGAAGGRFYVGVYTDFTAADSTNPADYTWSLQRGADGANGTPGAPGSDGQPSYVHIAYANNATGTLDFHLSDPTGRAYIGVYTDSTVADSSNPALYTWSLIKGSDGAAGAPGAAALSVSAAPAAITVPCTANGTPKAALQGSQLTVFQGSTDVTSTSSYSFTSSGLSGVSVSSAGAVSVTGISADSAYVEITVTKSGASQVIRIVYTKAYDGKAFVTDSVSIGAPSTTSFATVASLSLLMGPLGFIDLDANGGFDVGSGTINVQGTIDYSLNGGSSWTTAASFTGNAAPPFSSGDFAATGGLSGATIGLGSRQTVMFRVTMRKTNTNSFTAFGGSFGVTWSG